jgi:GNAT superfamily N-acetyltransferase
VRGERLGYQLMERALATCQQRWPNRALYLGAQAHLSGFYAHFGFVTVTDVYDEDGIAHVGMAREVQRRHNPHPATRISVYSKGKERCFSVRYCLISPSLLIVGTAFYP